MAGAPVSSHVLPGTDVPTDFTQMLKMAEMLAQAGNFLPEKLRGEPHSILAVMLHARALNIPLAVAWKELYVAWDGSVGQTAKLARALARRAGHRIKYVEYDRFHAVCLIHCKGEPEAHEVRFTIQDAINMGLTDTGKSGKGGQQYTKQPENMLVARVTTRAINRYCPEVLLGMPLTEEDMLAEEGDSYAFPDNDAVSAIREEHREAVADLLRLAELTGGQGNGVVRLALLRDLFAVGRDGLVLDFAADSTGEYSVRQVLLEKAKEANELAKRQASGEGEPVDPAAGPQTVDDLRSLAGQDAAGGGEPQETPTAEPTGKQAARKAAKRKPAKTPETAQEETPKDAVPPAAGSVPRQRTATHSDAPAEKDPAGRPTDRTADRPDGRSLPCGCIVDDVITTGRHGDACTEGRS